MANYISINANFVDANSGEKGSISINPFSISVWLDSIGRNSISNFSSEDNLQSLNSYQLNDFAKCMFDLMATNGRWRIAVPDGNNPEFVYQMRYKPNGFFQMLLTHKAQSFWNLNSLTSLLRKIGFIIYPLEYFDETGEFVKNDWDIKDGLIEHRSENRNKTQYLIIDAVKP